MGTGTSSSEGKIKDEVVGLAPEASGSWGAIKRGLSKLLRDYSRTHDRVWA